MTVLVQVAPQMSPEEEIQGALTRGSALARGAPAWDFSRDQNSAFPISKDDVRGVECCLIPLGPEDIEMYLIITLYECPSAVILLIT